MSIPSCRAYGCTDAEPCIEQDGWECCCVEPDLCSACAHGNKQTGSLDLLEETRDFIRKEGF